MTPTRRISSLLRFGAPVAFVLALAACTPGGQFDPTVIFANDMFDTKKTIQGPREPVFPTGVPGTTTGVPPELVKGYQPPPDQAAEAGTAPDGAAAPDAAAEAAAKPQPKPKPKPKLVRAPAQPQDPAFNQKTPTRISIGPGAKPAASAPPGTDTSQSIWPAPPPTGSAPQTAQPAQSIWPDPPAPGTSSQ
jgi:hypothetical protein